MPGCLYRVAVLTPGLMDPQISTCFQLVCLIEHIHNFFVLYLNRFCFLNSSPSSPVIDNVIMETVWRYSKHGCNLWGSISSSFCDLDYSWFLPFGGLCERGWTANRGNQAGPGPREGHRLPQGSNIQTSGAICRGAVCFVERWENQVYAPSVSGQEMAACPWRVVCERGVPPE